MSPRTRPYSRQRRDQIVSLLGEHGAMTVDDLLRHVPITHPTLCHHLRGLEHAGVIVSRLEAWDEVRYRRECGGSTNARRKPVYCLPADGLPGAP
jgi:DNA-binding transcriptional ArsR family regulator